MSGRSPQGRFGDLRRQGYQPAVGSWVQVLPSMGLSTVWDLGNFLGPQEIEVFLIDPDGLIAVEFRVDRLPAFARHRVDLGEYLPPDTPFEGTLWVWARGLDGPALSGTTMGLEFVDSTRPEGYCAASVHMLFDFFDTLDQPPFVDLVSPLVRVETTREGSPRFLNYLGIASLPIGSGTPDSGAPELQISLSNASGAQQLSDRIPLELFGSSFRSLESLFPGMHEFLAGTADRGAGTVGVREASDAVTGIGAMLKVTDVLTGELCADHLIDRWFSRVSLGKDA